MLECGGGVAKAKEHNSRFKEPLVSDKGCLPLVTVFDTDIVVAPMNIKFSKVVSIFVISTKSR